MWSPRSWSALLGAREVTFLIADYSGQAVTRFVRVGPVVEGERHSGAERAEAVPLAGTVYGQVLRTQQTVETSKDGGARLVTPVTDRGDALGLLELVLPAFQVQQLPLEPGDRIAFLTDGMLERNAARLDVTTALAESTRLHPRETVQALGGAVMALTRGQLRDDATVLLLDWHGGPPRPRETRGGADHTRASE